MFLVYYIIFFPVAIFVNVVVHEFGHAIPAVWFTRKKAEVFIGSHGDKTSGFVLRTKFFDIWIKFAASFSARGLCRPGAKKVSFRKQFIYTATGPLASLMLSCTVFFAFPLFDAGGEMLPIPFVFFSSALVLFLASTIPRGTANYSHDGHITHNDGYVLRKLWRLRKFEKEYNQAFEYYNAKEYRKAADLLELILCRNKNFAYVFPYSLSSLIMVKEYEKALKICNDVPANYSFTADDYCNIGLLKIRMDNYPGAIADLKKSLALNPAQQVSLNNIGYALILIKEFEKAIPYLEKAIELKPDFAYAFNNRGYAKIKLGDPAGGYEDIQKAMALDDTNAYAYRNMGVYYMALNEYEKALPYLKKALELHADTDLINDLIKEVSEKMQVSNIL